MRTTGRLCFIIQDLVSTVDEKGCVCVCLHVNDRIFHVNKQKNTRYVFVTIFTISSSFQPSVLDSEHHKLLHD